MQKRKVIMSIVETRSCPYHNCVLGSGCTCSHPKSENQECQPESRETFPAYCPLPEEKPVDVMVNRDRVFTCESCGHVMGQMECTCPECSCKK